MGQRRIDDGYTVHPQGAGGIPTLEYRGEFLPVDDPLQLRGVADAPLLAGELPVLLGCGTGRVMEQLSAHFQGAVAVVDAEGAIQKAFEARKHLPLELDVLWVDEEDADQILEELRSWQAKHEGAALRVFASSTYLKIRPRLYATILRGLKSRLGKGEKAPGCGGRLPRILLLRFNYFLEQEILAGLRAQDAPVREFAPQQDELADANAYVQGLLQAVGEWRPDYVLSVNSLASDAGGALSDLLQRLGVGYVTWFVDSPELFLHGRELPEGGGTVFFSCDPDFRAKLAPQTKGALDNVHYLPLAADHTRFDLKSEVTSLEPRMKVSFLGTTWVDKLARGHAHGLFLPKVRAQSLSRTRTRPASRGGTFRGPFPAQAPSGILGALPGGAGHRGAKGNVPPALLGGQQDLSQGLHGKDSAILSIDRGRQALGAPLRRERGRNPPSGGVLHG